MKDVKMKQTSTTPKIKPKETSKNINRIPSDVKSVFKDQYIRQKAELKNRASQEPEQNKPEDYAVNTVESKTNEIVQVTKQRSIIYAQNKVKQRRSNTIKTKDAVLKETEPLAEMQKAEAQSQRSNQTQRAQLVHNRTQASKVKTHDTGVKYVNTNEQVKTIKDIARPENKSILKQKQNQLYTIKTKENYLKEAKKLSSSELPKGPRVQQRVCETKTKGNSLKNADTSKITPTQQAKQKFAEQKLKDKIKNRQMNIPYQQTVEIPQLKNSNTIVKTKAQYIKTYTASRVENPANPYKKAKIQPDIKTKTQNGNESIRIVQNNPQKSVKVKQSVPDPFLQSPKTCKRGQRIHLPKSSAVRRVGHANKKLIVKTQKQVTKQAAKQTKKKARQAAQKSVQVTKQAAKTAVRVTTKTVKLVAKAAAAIISALAALGGWAVLLIVLIIVIIIAAIAGSPFGIFLTEEADDPNNIPISSIIAEVNIDFSQRLESLENAGQYARIETTGSEPSWDEVLAVFAVNVAGTDDETAQEVVIINEEKKQKLIATYWDMVQIETRIETVARPPESGEPNAPPTEEKILFINIVSKTAEDMIGVYHFTERQQEALKTLLENNEILLVASQSLAVSDSTAQDVLKNLPKPLPQKRKDVVKAACSLVGKVNYFWGGKSSAIGWDSEWGKMRRVSAAGSSSSGTVRPFGLDCSGFVTWAFHNSNMPESAIGHGTNGQVAKCTRISWAQAQAGDLAFYGNLSHVGIVVGKDQSGNILVCHCSSGRNNVVITTNAGFGFAARPLCY